MKAKIYAIFAVLLAVAIFTGGRAFLAVAESVRPDVAAKSDKQVSEDVRRLNLDIQAKKDKLEELKQRQEEYQEAIRQRQAEQSDLENQLAIFDNRLASLQINIEKVKASIEKTLLEIQRIDMEINIKQEEIENQKEKIAAALGLLYKEGDKSDLEIMLMNDNFTEYLDQVKHIKDINSGISASLDSLKKNKSKLEQNREDLDLEKMSFKKLQAELLERQAELESEKDSRELLLAETQASEAEYQRLLQLAKEEQQEAAREISSLEKTVRQKLAGDKRFEDLDTSAEGFMWPVSGRTITATFHDPDYPYRHIFEHPAIDIRASQGTTISAAASGYVARVKWEESSAYAYIMIVHSDGLATVYGHVSAVYVSEEDYVIQGDTIGLTGGMPGTYGSGRLSTGPHLHFEIRKDGIPVNPEEYLP